VRRCTLHSSTGDGCSLRSPTGCAPPSREPGIPDLVAARGCRLLPADAWPCPALPASGTSSQAGVRNLGAAPQMGRAPLSSHRAPGATPWLDAVSAAHNPKGARRASRSDTEGSEHAEPVRTGRKMTTLAIRHRSSSQKRHACAASGRAHRPATARGARRHSHSRRRHLRLGFHVGTAGVVVQAKRRPDLPGGRPGSAL
jgi:hypothetical protein